MSSDIFVSYAREDGPRVQQLVVAFESRRWSVFWDRHIPVGQNWRRYLGTAMQDARCVVVVWSTASLDSDWVHEEAEDARARGLLVPVLLEPVTPPYGFRSVQAADLVAWDGSPDAINFQALASAIEEHIGVSGRSEFNSVQSTAGKQRTLLETLRSLEALAKKPELGILDPATLDKLERYRNSRTMRSKQIFRNYDEVLDTLNSGAHINAVLAKVMSLLSAQERLRLEQSIEDLEATHMVERINDSISTANAKLSDALLMTRNGPAALEEVATKLAEGARTGSRDSERLEAQAAYIREQLAKGKEVIAAMDGRRIDTVAPEALGISGMSLGELHTRQLAYYASLDATSELRLKALKLIGNG